MINPNEKEQFVKECICMHHFAFLYQVYGAHGKYAGAACHSLLQWITFTVNSPPVIRPSCVAWHGVAHGFIELLKPLHHDKAAIMKG